jgi:hypothetical protein
MPKIIFWVSDTFINFAFSSFPVRNRCALKLCKNGLCIDDSSDYHVDLPLNGYLCICKDGFQGENCDRKLKDFDGKNLTPISNSMCCLDVRVKPSFPYVLGKVCDNCHKDAVCLYGQCICKNGFVGNGKTCKSKYAVYI